MGGRVRWDKVGWDEMECDEMSSENGMGRHVYSNLVNQCLCDTFGFSKPSLPNTLLSGKSNALQYPSNSSVLQIEP